jgi:hypothetical protein
MSQNNVRWIDEEIVRLQEAGLFTTIRTIVHDDTHHRLADGCLGDD